MTPDLLLTAAQVQALTDRTYPRYQIAWLTAHGWKFDVGADGRPKIATAYFEQRLGVKATPRKGPRLDGLAAARRQPA
jgi:hypothetical protein